MVVLDSSLLDLPSLRPCSLIKDPKSKNRLYSLILDNNLI